MEKKEEMVAEITYNGKSAVLGTPEANALVEDMVRHSFGISGKVGILTPPQLLSQVQMLRSLCIANANRIPKFKQVADRLGSIETILIDELGIVEDKKQEKLPLDNPEKVDKELNGGEKKGKK